MQITDRENPRALFNEKNVCVHKDVRREEIRLHRHVISSELFSRFKLIFAKSLKRSCTDDVF